jgi:hypothetical protein
MQHVMTSRAKQFSFAGSTFRAGGTHQLALGAPPIKNPWKRQESIFSWKLPEGETTRTRISHRCDQLHEG